MKLHLSTAIPRSVLATSFAHAMHVAGYIVLGGAAILILAATVPEWSLVWPALTALIAATVFLVILDRQGSDHWAALFVASGVVTVYLAESTLAVLVRVDDLALTITTTMLRVSLLLGASRKYRVHLRWCVLGYVGGELAAFLAMRGAGSSWRFDPVPLVILILIVVILGSIHVSQRRAERGSPRFEQAAQDELTAVLRARLESRATALLHDTVLGHLAAIAASPGDRLAPELAEQVQRDLTRLITAEWLDEPADVAGRTEEWTHGPFFQAVQEARQLGLLVGVTGDVEAVGRVADATVEQLALAVKQCLVNVYRHAGTRDAEVAVYGSADEVLVMVVDTGVGFDPATAEAGGIGLRSSVRARIEAIGGSVQVWSTVGRGTSVVIRVPVCGLSAATAVDLVPGGTG